MSQSGIPLPLVRWRGFTLQMFLFTVLPLTVLLLVIAFGSLSLHHDSMRALVGDRDLRAVRAASNSLSNEIQFHGTTLQLFANEVSQARNTAVLLDQNIIPGFDGGLALLAPSGHVISGGIPTLPDLAEHMPAVHGTGVAYSPPVQAKDGSWWVLAVTSTAQGEKLVGAFSPAALARSALAGVAGAGQNTLLLLSSQGEVLYQSGTYNHNLPILQHAGVAEVLRGESGVNYQTGDGGTGHNHGQSLSPFSPRSSEHVVSFSPVAPLGWGLVLEEPWEQTAGPMLQTTQFAPLILAPVLILALLALWFGARQIIQPLQSLENRAGQLAAGDFAAIRAPVGGISEIRNLQEQLVEMASSLQSAQEALHGYIGALTAGVETERRSLARELHDDTLQALIALNQHVQMTLLRASDPQQRQALLDLQGRVTETIANLRRAIGGLRPIYLEDLGLVAALGMLAKGSDTNHAPNAPVIEFSVKGSERRLPPETELAFYRITQEALNNAIHHAAATQVQISLDFTPTHARLSICDNGPGFRVPTNPAEFAHAGHYGLLGMYERADLAGAELKITSAPGKGTRVEVEKEEREKFARQT